MNKPLIIALDFPGLQEVKRFLNEFEGEKLYVKVGMELFYKEGPQILTYLREQQHQIFLDLKLHDIPNTVKNGMKSLASYGVDMVNVHALGGQAMMEAALEGLEAGTPSGEKRPYCIAVTQLTSTSVEQMQREQLIQYALQEVVIHYAALARKSGLDGVVCSTLEVPLIRQKIGEKFLTVTPGIRLANQDVNDQVRVATPELARQYGTGAIVVGRAITRAQQPLEAYKQVKQEWEGVQV
jgi:orotidine-5'-phosphate decarboxylase